MLGDSLLEVADGTPASHSARFYQNHNEKNPTPRLSITKLWQAQKIKKFENPAQIGKAVSFELVELFVLARVSWISEL